MLNAALFIKELMENRIKFWIALAILSALAIVIPLLYDLTGEILRGMDLAPYVNPAELAFIYASYDNYAWSQWTAKNLTQLASLTAIVLGMGTLAGEASYGTAPFLLSKPLSRRQIYATKAAAGLFLLALAMGISTLLLLFVSALKGYTLQTGAFVVSVFLVFAGVAVVYLGTALFSVLIPDPVKAGVAAAVFWGLASLPGFSRGLAQYSLFYQMKGVRYWLHGAFPWPALLLILVAGYLFFAVGVYYWCKKDF